MDFTGTKKGPCGPFFNDLQTSVDVYRSKSGAGNETCTRTVSRCFPITFFAEVASEDLNCSLVFRPRQQIRPKSSTDVHRAALSTPDPQSVHRRRRLPRTHHPRAVVCLASIIAKTIRQMVLVMAQVGYHLGTPAPQLTGYLLPKLLWKNAHAGHRVSAHDSLSIYQDDGASMTGAGLLRPAGHWTTIAAPSCFLRPLAYQVIPRRFCRNRNFSRP